MNTDSVWLPPCGDGRPLGGGGYAALEKLLDGDAVAAPQHDEGCWGKATGAHFWGNSVAPVRRAVAAVVPVRTPTDTPVDLQSKASAYRKDSYERRLRTAWPRGLPEAFSTSRALGTVPAKKANKVVVCTAAVRGLYLAPLTPAEVRAAAAKLQDDLSAAVRPPGVLVVTSLRPAPGGAAVTFEVAVAAAEAKDATRRCKSAAMAQVLLQNACSYYARLGARPTPSKLLLNDVGALALVCVRRGGIRGAVVEDGRHDAGGAPTPLSSAASSLAALGTARAGYSAAEPKPKPKPVLKAAGATAAERKKNLLAGVMKKTAKKLNDVEMENPRVASSYELQRKKEAVNSANQKLAESRGEGMAQLIASARETLKPPSEWKGALVREDGGRKHIENFELNLVDLSRETRTMVGRARIQNLKMDMTYQCKARVLQKDGALTVELVLDNSGVCMGKFPKRGVITGSFKFPNGAGTFKLIRSEA
eukprot:TRINITY_DN17990_c0_g1_i1.p1 TRINITY_DN17990_c0_g1~~TRINITY_DN17990_c0_g1_i1.p1  ORF type:complete len:477 (+),score=195.10 TRINITY_DN17990_c0_g1_i1:54-1484(+)